jgi:hypothetical protein
MIHNNFGINVAIDLAKCSDAKVDRRLNVFGVTSINYFHHGLRPVLKSVSVHGVNVTLPPTSDI